MRGSRAHKHVERLENIVKDFGFYSEQIENDSRVLSRGVTQSDFQRLTLAAV